MLAEVAAQTTARLAEVSAQASARLTEVAAHASARLAEAAQNIAPPAPETTRETGPPASAPQTGNGYGSGSPAGAPGEADAACAAAAVPVSAQPTAALATAEPAVAAAPAADRKAHWRAPGLDGLRALAVLAVLAFHESLPWFRGGFLGVDVFFVLSGFLITDLLAARFALDGHVGLGTFWLRRARRLLPALALMLVTVTAAIAVLEPGQMAALRPSLLGAVSYTSNWWQALAHQSYFAQFGPPPPLQHLWSLAVEEQFYLVWPLVMAAVLIAVRRPAQRAMVAWIGALASALAMLAIYVPGSDPSLVYYGTDTHASALMIGAALALTWPLAKVAAATKPLRHWLDACGAVGLAILCWAVWHFSGANPAVYPFGLVLAALAAGGVVLAAAAPGKVGTMLAWRPLRWLGVRSYGIYLWHWPVIAITVGVVGQAASSVTARIADAALPIALAAASWHWIEEPILRNGLRADMRHRGRQLRQTVTRAWRGPAAALPLLGALAMLAVVCTAGYGIAQRQTGPTLEEQIAKGAQISALTQADQQADPSQLADPADPWRIRAIGIGPYRVDRARRAQRARGARVPGWKAIAIGDSVMLASAPELASALPGIYINAKVSRSMIAGISIIQRLAADRRLRPVVIVGLGTNGPVSLYQIHQLRMAIGRSRWLVLINVFEQRSWESEVNTTLAAAASRYPNVLLVNWHRAIEHRTGLLWSDGIHPQPSGGKLYARVVRAVVMTALHHRPRPRHPRQPPNSGYPLHASDARQ
jgi:peptidoglycan/LPS O-acetylase OafA/YrhL